MQLGRQARSWTSRQYDTVSPVRAVVLDTGGRVVAGDQDGTLRSWDVGHRARPGHRSSPTGGAVAALAMIDLDGRHVAVSGGADGTWASGTSPSGRAAAPPRVGHEGSVRGRRSSRTVRSGSSDGRLPGLGLERHRRRTRSARPMLAWVSARRGALGMAVSRSPRRWAAGPSSCATRWTDRCSIRRCRDRRRTAGGRRPVPVIGATVSRRPGVRGRRARRRPTVAAQPHGIPSAHELGPRRSPSSSSTTAHSRSCAVTTTRSGSGISPSALRLILRLRAHSSRWTPLRQGSAGGRRSLGGRGPLWAWDLSRERPTPTLDRRRHRHARSHARHARRGRRGRRGRW